MFSKNVALDEAKLFILIKLKINHFNFYRSMCIK